MANPRLRVASRPPIDADAAAAPSSGLFGFDTPPEAAEVVIVPLPFAGTSAGRGGASRGPAAVLKASHLIELIDREHGRPFDAGIAMLPVSRRIQRLSDEAEIVAAPLIRRGGPEAGNSSHSRAVAKVDAAGDMVNDWLRAKAKAHLSAGQLVGVLGGDHSVPFGLIAELSDRHPGLGILQVDAHAGLRLAHQGFTWSHGSIMRNVLTRLPGVSKIVQVGMRDVGESEFACIEDSGPRISSSFDADLRRQLASGASWDSIACALIAQLPKKVHVSIDVDGLDPSLCPHARAPVPGGLSWGELCHLLVVLAESGRRVVGFDLVEVSPGPRGQDWDASVGARVLYKLIGCALRTRVAP